jgi:hypothetical protein
MVLLPLYRAGAEQQHAQPKKCSHPPA